MYWINQIVNKKLKNAWSQKLESLYIGESSFCHPSKKSLKNPFSLLYTPTKILTIELISYHTRFIPKIALTDSSLLNPRVDFSIAAQNQIPYNDVLVALKFTFAFCISTSRRYWK